MNLVSPETINWFDYFCTVYDNTGCINGDASFRLPPPSTDAAQKAESFT